MKKILALLVAAAVAMPVVAAQEVAKPTTKKVCVIQKDAKTGKNQQVCKTIKVHKKHTGTKVPESKK